jgi:hypothetical protein
MFQKGPRWLIFFVNVGISIHLHTVESPLSTEADNLVVILYQICIRNITSRQLDHTYVGVDGQQILIEVFVGRGIQENSVLYRMDTGFSIICIIRDMLLP